MAMGAGVVCLGAGIVWGQASGSKPGIVLRIGAETTPAGTTMRAATSGRPENKSPSATAPATTRAVPGEPPATTRKSLTVRGAPFVQTGPIKVIGNLLDPEHGLMPKDYDGEGGRCDTLFRTDFGYDVTPVTVRRTDERFVGTMKCSGPWTRITLTLTLWLPAHPALYLLDHEETHREVSERVYAEGIVPMAAVLKAMEGKIYTAAGKTEAEAREAAKQAPINEFNDASGRLFGGRARRINVRFDTVTRHGIFVRKPNRELMEDLFKEDAKGEADTATQEGK